MVLKSLKFLFNINHHRHDCLIINSPEFLNCEMTFMGFNTTAWLYNSTITKLYRKFTHAHYEIVPYLYTSGIDAYQNRDSLITPLS